MSIADLKASLAYGNLMERAAPVLSQAFERARLGETEAYWTAWPQLMGAAGPVVYLLHLTIKNPLRQPAPSIDWYEGVANHLDLLDQAKMDDLFLRGFEELRNARSAMLKLP